MDEAVFIAQYTFLATPAVIEEESRILGKIARRLRCEYVIRFEDDGKFYFLLETRSGYRGAFRPVRLVHRQPDRLQQPPDHRHGLVRERELGGLHVQARFRQRGRGTFLEQYPCIHFLQRIPQGVLSARQPLSGFLPLGRQLVFIPL